jgi:hypothetical protein
MNARLLRLSVVSGTVVSCCLAAAVGIATAAPPPRTRLEIRDGWYYVNGQKFFVNALGYEIGARPGQQPYQQRGPEPARLKADLAIIKGAGFNAIRTWSELYESELKRVQESGLKIVFGIWVKPDEDFGDPKVVARDVELVKSVLSYTKNYDCIITYLIMNEPMPEHVRKVGAQATVNLWTKLRDLIHKEHPGIPVTITGNSAVGEFFDMNLFDVYAFNAYDYGSGVNFTHGYANANRFLRDLNGGPQPMILTEFGLSVSRAGDGHYGGNTLEEQARALPRYYRGLLDAGAVGACPFYFADGWWKGGEPALHNDTPEEWFGFWGYRDVKDAVGYPRPVWYALKTYNKALVASPKNQAFYQNEVPLEIFLQDDVARLRVISRDKILLESGPLAGGYFSGALSFAGEDLTDRELVFELYDKLGALLKIETLIVLTGPDPIEWPTLAIRTALKDLDDGPDLAIELVVKNRAPFTLGSELRYLYSHHKGWEPGPERRFTLDPSKNAQTFKDVYRVPGESPVMAVYAGAEVRYGKFVKTIYDQRFIYRGNWADPIRLK